MNEQLKDLSGRYIRKGDLLAYAGDGFLGFARVTSVSPEGAPHPVIEATLAVFDNNIEWRLFGRAQVLFHQWQCNRLLVLHDSQVPLRVQLMLDRPVEEVAA